MKFSRLLFIVIVLSLVFACSGDKEGGGQAPLTGAFNLVLGGFGASSQRGLVSAQSVQSSEKLNELPVYKLVKNTRLFFLSTSELSSEEIEKSIVFKNTANDESVAIALEFGPKFKSFTVVPAATLEENAFYLFSLKDLKDKAGNNLADPLEFIIQIIEDPVTPDPGDSPDEPKKENPIIEFKNAPKELESDGQSSITITSEIVRQANGDPIEDGKLFTVFSPDDILKIESLDQDPNMPGVQILSKDGVVSFDMSAGLTAASPGVVIISALDGSFFGQIGLSILHKSKMVEFIVTPNLPDPQGENSDGDNEFGTIAGALAAVPSSLDKTYVIRIKGGIWYETISVNDKYGTKDNQLIITAFDPNVRPIIMGPLGWFYEVVVLRYCSYVTIDRLDLMGRSNKGRNLGISDRTSNFTISRNRFFKAPTAIEVVSYRGGKGGKIINNIFVGGYNDQAVRGAIAFGKDHQCSGILIAHNLFYKNIYGLYVNARPTEYKVYYNIFYPAGTAGVAYFVKDNHPNNISFSASKNLFYLLNNAYIATGKDYSTQSFSFWNNPTTGGLNRDEGSFSQVNPEFKSIPEDFIIAREEDLWEKVNAREFPNDFLHLKSTSGIKDVEQMKDYKDIVGLYPDFDGEVRDAKPDVGPDEFFN